MTAEHLTYSDILRRNAELGKSLAHLPSFEIHILSNIVTSQLNAILEHALRSSGLHAKVISGEYDNILQDSQRVASAKAVLLHWELANLVDGLQYKAEIMPEGEIASLETKLQGEIEFALRELRGVPLVVLSRFSTLLFTHQFLRPGPFERLGVRMNRFLDSISATNPNLVLIDIDKVIAAVSIAKSADMRFFHSAKSLYTVAFYRELAAAAAPVFRSMHGQTKKAIVFDCDNTLWKGILGEDGPDHIAVSAAFEEVQVLAKSLRGQGVLIGICSKNNPGDVASVLANHKGMALQPDDFVITRVDWADKVTNLKDIASELNIGLDSVVFVDDSDFEIGLVNDVLPEVETLQVPANVSAYPGEMRRLMRQFFQLQSSREDQRRSELYEEGSRRDAERAKFESLEDYLAALELRLSVSVDDESQKARVAQLTQKTNQFNLTTRRYTEAEIGAFMAAPSHSVYSVRASDRFGDYGIIGICMVECAPSTDGVRASIDTLLMSCRALGRNLEWAFLDAVIGDLRDRDVQAVHATYVPTSKNIQVERFFDTAGFALVGESGGRKDYAVSVGGYQARNVSYIGVQRERPD